MLLLSLSFPLVALLLHCSSHSPLKNLIALSLGVWSLSTCPASSVAPYLLRVCSISLDVLEFPREIGAPGMK